MRNRLITKIILAYLALVAVAAPVLWLFLSGTIEGYLTDRIAENLKAEANILARELPPLNNPAKLDALAASFKALTGARVTIIDPLGKVLGDSNRDSETMENHIGRPEVQAAIAGGWGSSKRYSRTLKIDMIYVALAVKAGEGGPGFIRLSMPLHQVEEAMARIKREVASGAFLVFMAAVIMGVVLSRRITGTVGEMAAFTKDVSSGDFSKRLRVRGRDELGVLAANLNDMAGQLKDKIDAITKEKATLEAVLGGMIEGVLVTGGDGAVILANRRLRETFGLDMQGLRGRHFLEVIRNSELSGLVDLAHRKRELVTGEVEVQFPEKAYFVVSCVPLMMKDEFAGVVLVLHDVTRLKALERVRRDFAANVTHELKTPIAAIQGFAETLLAGALEERDNARRFLGIIESNSRRLTGLIDDLLTLSKIELGEVSITLRPTPLRGVVMEAAALLEPKIREKRLKLNLGIPEDLPDAAADRDKLYQIILNVLDNAVKFTPEGGEVGVAARASKGGEGMVELVISDTGLGIPPDMLPRLGERFFRVDAARSRELGGTGLGLAIVKHLIKAHGGALAIDSYPQKGTTVTLSFKAAI